MVYYVVSALQQVPPKIWIVLTLVIWQEWEVLSLSTVQPNGDSIIYLIVLFLSRYQQIDSFLSFISVVYSIVLKCFLSCLMWFYILNTDSDMHLLLKALLKLNSGLHDIKKPQKQKSALQPHKTSFRASAGLGGILAPPTGVLTLLASNKYLNLNVSVCWDFGECPALLNMVFKLNTGYSPWLGGNIPESCHSLNAFCSLEWNCCCNNHQPEKYKSFTQTHRWKI